jgi:hypothetical protein
LGEFWNFHLRWSFINVKYWKVEGKNLITNAKITKQQAEEIKLLIAEGILAFTKIANMYGVSPGTINKIAKGTHWK